MNDQIIQGQKIQANDNVNKKIERLQAMPENVQGWGIWRGKNNFQ